MPKPVQFEINVAQDKLDTIRGRVAAYRAFAAPDTANDWQFGMSSRVLEDIRNHWLTGYDWRADWSALAQSKCGTR